MPKTRLREKIRAFLSSGNNTPLKMKASDWAEFRKDKELMEKIGLAEKAQDSFRERLEEIQEHLAE